MEKQCISDKNIKNDIKSTTLAFEFVMYTYQTDEETTYNIIDKINHKYFYDIPEDKRKSKLIDIYKSNNIANYIKEIVDEFYPKLNNQKRHSQSI